MITLSECLSLLNITEWVRRPIVPACWVMIKNLVILAETQDFLGKFNLEEKRLFQAILKAFSWPEALVEKAALFNSLQGVQQFPNTMTILWIWGESVEKHITTHSSCFKITSPSLKKLLQNPQCKRKLWEDGLLIKSQKIIG